MIMARKLWEGDFLLMTEPDQPTGGGPVWATPAETRPGDSVGVGITRIGYENLPEDREPGIFAALFERRIAAAAALKRALGGESLARENHDGTRVPLTADYVDALADSDSAVLGTAWSDRINAVLRERVDILRELANLLKDQSPQSPSIPNAFSNGHGLISSSLALQGVLASLHDGQAGGETWRKGADGFPAFDYVQSQGTARVVLRPDADSTPSQALADVLWGQVTKFSDMDVDVLLAMMAQAIGPGSADADGATWIKASTILDYRGVQPIMKREGRIRRRAGHRTEDLQEIAACVGRLASQWVELLAVETRDVQGRRKPPKVTRTTYESPLVTIEGRVRQSELDGESHVLAWQYRLGRCITDFLHGPNRQVAPIMQKVLQYDPYRERFEKRLALYFTIHHRIAASYRAPLRRKVSRLFDELRLPLDRRNPNRCRERFEKALERLVRDGVLVGCQYTADSQRKLKKLPGYGWIDDWLDCSIETPPARAELPSGT